MRKKQGAHPNSLKFKFREAVNKGRLTTFFDCFFEDYRSKKTLEIYISKSINLCIERKDDDLCRVILQGLSTAKNRDKITPCIESLKNKAVEVEAFEIAQPLHNFLETDDPNQKPGPVIT